MGTSRVIVALLVALGFSIHIPSEGLAQGGQQGRQIPQPQGGIATVIGVDQPENCLRIRSGPGYCYDVIGCAYMGDQLNITGVWTSNDWAQLADNGWVYGPQIQTDLRPPRTAYFRNPSYIVSEEVTPVYDDWGYLPDYGYDTYWCGGIPLFLYNVAVWHGFHPWWWHRGQHAWWWQGDHHGKRVWNQHEFNNFARTGSQRAVITNRANVFSFSRAHSPKGFATNRPNISSSDLNRLNTNSFRSGTTNAYRSRNLTMPHNYRLGSTNTVPSRNFSAPQTFRSGGNFGARQFSSIGRSGGLSTARFGGGGGGHFRNGAHFGGGGRR